MLATQDQLRGRIEELKLSFNGYNRQLDRPNLTPDRRERLEVETQMLDEEIRTLEKLAQLGRVEADRAKIELSVRERLAVVRQRISADLDMQGFSQDDLDESSGEIRAFLWALGEDRMSYNVRIIMEGHDKRDPNRTAHAMPTILIHTIEEGPNPESRGSAAYDLGKLHITQGIPALATALKDEPMVADVALGALCSFSDEELQAAGLGADVLGQVRKARARTAQK